MLSLAAERDELRAAVVTSREKAEALESQRETWRRELEEKRAKEMAAAQVGLGLGLGLGLGFRV